MSEEQKPKKKSKKWIWGVVVLFVIIALAGSGGDKEDPVKPVATPVEQGQTNEQEKQQEADSKVIKSGMYKVGADIPAGEYLIYTTGTGYFEVTKDSSGTLDSIVTNDNFSGTRYVTVQDGQYLEFKGAKMLPATDVEPQQPKDGAYPEGMYKVGKDVPPGEYKVVSAGGLAYFEVAKDSTGGLYSIISNDNFDGEKYVTISDGQYIKLTGCKLMQ